MNYEYKVFKAKSALFLGIDLDTYGRDGWKFVSVVWDNFRSCLVTVMMQERQMISFLIYTFTSFKKVRE